MRRFRVRLSLACLGALLHSSLGSALPGTHGPSISTFDTRGSSVVLAYREGFADSTLRAMSYNANFSATGGNFSAQFGAHYLQFRDIPGVALAHGAGAAGVGLFSIPLASRFANGVPKAALALYLGASPMAAVSGYRNFLTAPVVFGTGVSLAPASWVTLTPWIEASPSVNWDTYIDPDGVSVSQQAQVLPNGEIVVDTPDVDQILADAVDSRLSFHTGLKLGLMLTAHLGEVWDFNLYADYLTLGSTFGGTPILQAGAGLGFHWDDIVPAVLPAQRRLQTESCEDVSERFMSCPQYRQLLEAAPAGALPPEVGAPPPSPAEPEPAPAQPSAPPPAPEPSAPPPAASEPLEDSEAPSGPPRAAFPPP